MKSRTRNIYPGGNTPYGFHSYYNHILPQRKAEKIFCIKGGPGTGKSTMMKRIAEHFGEKDELIELMWCSSDPKSLDAVVLADRRIALIDATSPHITDPINPGAVDTIIDLGKYRDDTKLRACRGEIIKLTEEISACFQTAYTHLGAAGKYYDEAGILIEKALGKESMYDIKRRIKMAVGSIPAMKRAEVSALRESAKGAMIPVGSCRCAFAGAVTPDGIRSGLDSIAGQAERIVMIKAPDSFGAASAMESVSERALGTGFDVEKYFCPLAPDKKTEHIIIPEIKTAVLTCNSYHGAGINLTGKKVHVIDIGAEFDSESRDGDKETVKEMNDCCRKAVEMAVAHLKHARLLHDELENYYVEAMDHKGLEAVTENIIEEIETMKG